MQGPMKSVLFFPKFHVFLSNSLEFCFFSYLPNTQALGNKWSLHRSTHSTQLTKFAKEHIDAEKPFRNCLPLYFGVILEFLNEFFLGCQLCQVFHRCFSSDALVVPCISNPLQDKNVPLSPKKKKQNLSPVMDNSSITHVSDSGFIGQLRAPHADAFIFP